MTQLALDDVDRHAFASEPHSVGVAQLMGRERTADTSFGGRLA